MTAIKNRDLRAVAMLSVVATISALLYVAMEVNVPIAVLVWAGHDDGLFLQHAYDIAAKQWLGPYSQFTLMKGPGYPLFLAATHLFRLPVVLAQALFYSCAVYLLSLATLLLSKSRLIAVLVFEVALWNFGPDTERLLREDIYQSEFLFSFSLLILAFFSKGRLRLLLTGVSGLFLGWMWVTREEGITVLPALFLLLLYFSYQDCRSSRRLPPAAAFLGTFVISFASIPAAISWQNFRVYHTFATVDIKGNFESALEALASINTGQHAPHLEVSRKAREEAYQVSPTFARLHKYFDDPGSPAMAGWKTAGCRIFASTCGDYAYGYFMWALRDAAALDGDYSSAPAASMFYRRIHDEIEHACDTRAISCNHPILPFLPRLDAAEYQAIPKSLLSLIRKLTFIDPPPAAPQFQYSLGTPEQLRFSAAFLHIQSYTPAAGDLAAALHTGFAAPTIQIRTFVIQIYSIFLAPLIAAGFLAFLLHLGQCIWKRTLPLSLVITFAAWLTVVIRIFLLAVIDASSFPAAFDQYLSFAFPVSCFAALVSIYELARAYLGVKAPSRFEVWASARVQGISEAGVRPDAAPPALASGPRHSLQHQPQVQSRWTQIATFVFMTDLLRDIFRYRELIWALAMKDLKIRYKNSVLGFLWALLNPALIMLVLTLVFSTVMRFPIPHYAIFLLSVLLPWTFFTQSLSYAVESVVGNADLIKKVSVSKMVFPVAAVISNMVNLLLSFIPLAILVFALGHPFYGTWVYLPVPLIALTMFTLGATFFFATANVYYRDVAHILQIVIQAWFYLTPIIYPLSLFPGQYQWLFKLNPIIYVLNGFRLSVYNGQLPQLRSILASFVCAIVALFIGFTLFRKHQDEFVYYV